MNKPILCLDFDGVIHSYVSGWKGLTTIPDPVTPGFFDWLEDAVQWFDVVVFSSRSSDPRGIKAMREWMRHEAIAHYVELSQVPIHVLYLKFVDTKPAAFITIDDRALLFSGKWSDYNPETLTKFKPWYQRKQFTQPPVGHDMTAPEKSSVLSDTVVPTATTDSVAGLAADDPSTEHNAGIAPDGDPKPEPRIDPRS